jgi:nucleotide-binding universal stress UspA family protein
VSYWSAVNDFREARRRAAMEQIMARLTGRTAELLSYDEVRAKLKAGSSKQVGLRDIPLDAIVGSVGRYTDFTRSFLPRQDSDRGRWARVQMAITDLTGVPPIEVYQIGDVYFVRDGNHRVSVARQFDAPTIQAYVTEVRTRVPLTPDVQPDDLILKAEYVDFLERTRLDEARPQADLSVTVPGQYDKLLEHIAVHRYFMGLDQERDISYQEAVVHWYDKFYIPVVRVIRERGVLCEFPERTETDLYLWVLEHRGALEEALGWEPDTAAAAADMAAQSSPRPRRVVARVGERILDAIMPDGLETGPPPGQWREERLSAWRRDRLFADILVPISGDEMGWQAQDQALEVARREDAQLRGLHISASEAQQATDAERVVQEEFDRRCQDADVPGNLVLAYGKVSRLICERARWADLVVVSLSHPPGSQVMSRLGSGFRALLLRCSTPVLTVPGACSPLSRALLAYDGSPKAEEALFVATYVAGRWGIPLVVVSVQETSHTAEEAVDRVQDYLASRRVQATFVRERGPAGDVILGAARDHGCDLILMGGYGHSPVVEVMLDSAVNRVLRESQWPVLICR